MINPLKIAVSEMRNTNNCCGYSAKGGGGGIG